MRLNSAPKVQHLCMSACLVHQPGSSDAICACLDGCIYNSTWLERYKSDQRAWLMRCENHLRFSGAWLTWVSLAHMSLLQFSEVTKMQARMPHPKTNQVLSGVLVSLAHPQRCICPLLSTAPFLFGPTYNDTQEHALFVCSLFLSSYLASGGPLLHFRFGHITPPCHIQSCLLDFISPFVPMHPLYLIDDSSSLHS